MSPLANAKNSKDSESPKKTPKVTEEHLKQYKSDCERLYHNASYRDGSKQKAYDEISEREKQLKELNDKLKNFTESLGKKGDENILHNLCTGLETFLGFDSASRGYTGKGIVYSDLDRLCDGVMGFLSGVLSNIKEHLGQHKGEITEAINTLKQNKHAGKKGFNVAIGSVVAGVGGYNGNVRNSNNYVKNPIEALLNHVREGGELDKAVDKIPVCNVSKEAVITAVTLVEQCRGFANVFHKAFNLNTQPQMKIAVEDLNPDIQVKIDNAKKNIGLELTRLTKYSQQKRGKQWTDLETTITLIEKTSTDLGECVNVNMRNRVTDLVRQLKTKVEEIKKQLQVIDQKMQWYIDRLNRWIVAADEMLKKPIKDAGEVGISLPGGENQDNIRKKAAELKEKGETLFWHFNSTKDNVEKNVTEALAKVKEMDEALKGDLWKVKDAVSKQVGEIKTAIGKLYKVVETGDTEGATHNSMVEMVDLIKNKIKTIEGVGGRFVTKPTGLWAISQQVPTYVKTFENFDATVADWVREIVRRMVANNGPLHEHIDMYASEIETLQNNREQLLPKVKEQIITKVIAKVKEIALAHKADLATNGNVETDLKLIKRFLDHFNGQSLQNGVDHIVSAIEKAGELQVDPSKQNVIHNSDLKNAVNIVLHVFSMAAEKMGEQIQKLATDCHLGKINEALTTASDFEEKLKQATGNQSVGTSSSRINFALAVDNAIREVTEELGRKLITAAGDTVTLETTTAFSKYDGFVDQDKVSSLSKSDFEAIKSAGHLPAAIGAIRDTAKTDFENAKNIINNVTSFNTLSEAIATNLSDLLRAFEKVGQSIKVTLSNLKINTIGMKDKGAKAAEGSLQEIQQHLSNLKTFDLNNAIQKAKNFFEKEAIEVQTKCIQEIEKHVNSEVKKGRDIIIAQVRANYVTSVKELLQQFSSKVTDELKHLPTEITQDADKKFKGFMKEIEAQLKTDNIKNALPPNAKLATFAGCISNFFGGILYSLNTKRDIMPPHKITEIDTTLNTLLNGLSNYNKKFVVELSAVNTLIDGIHPESFSEDSNKLLDILTKGLRKFHDELDKAYISIYDGEPWRAEYSSRYAKVCLTIIHLGVSLPMLRVNCKSLSGQQINKNGDLGKLFADEGYRVSDRGEQNGELQDQDWMKGDQIQKRLTWPISGVNNEHLRLCESTKKHDKFSLIHFMACLVDHLGQYNDVCHIAPPSKGNAPCNVYQMLCWLDGLPHSPVYQDLIIDGFSGLFEKPGEQHKDVQSDDLPVIDENADTLDAYPKPITAAALRATLDEVCKQSHNVLTSILGYGHAGGVYACEFTNNSQGLVYPNNMNSLICTLVDILRRLHYQLYFICQQCLYNTELGGWRDCWYGREIGGSNWKCNTIQCANQDAGQKHNQRCDQKCDQNTTCGLKSPLQSYLEDGLPGFLPHLVTSKGPKMSCGTCARASPEMPCLTPMGFSDISNLASHRRKGQQLYMALTGFCSSVNSPLTKLCSMFNCIIPSAPKTLDYMFAVFYQLLHDWDEDRNETRIKHTKQGFNFAVNEAYFNDNYDFGDVSLMFKSKRHAAFVYVKENEVDSLYHHRGNLYSIFNPDDACYTATMTCGAYISPICLDAYSALSSNNGKLYVSWIIYTIEKFYDLLCQLCRRCTGNCTGQSKKCRVSGCAKTVCNVDAIDSLATKAHSESCNSIVQCPNTLPTLYTYGFTYGNRVSLNGLVNKSCVPKRTCKDFSEQLNKVCSQASVLSKLIHVTIPEFLFRIRLPFMLLVLALWSLSLFYLICVMVGRLDVLHIKSHLRIPSSHRITAQSLLAAAQVGRLAKISYLQP
ncbi:hypothetical protein, conserved [Babesia bigemina]|uniref:C3H1-type domain-containing protein n=1 Tax=Babesia bigemina TaxID=5866 RepID=A0A061BR12_BABBI|nr:hypothetical protein, conserved [Babesia bigemina]CDR71893.1 hypothetical protein, conserved [Babesia bigemina]|eukprot:XP_012770835.1 hypothetical protein, conserved [Babesia bigemina]